MPIKWKSFFVKVIDVLDDILAYVLTIVGIVFSNYIPLLKTNQTIDLNLSLGRIVVAAIVALIIVGRQEYIPIKGDNAEARAGRRRNFTMRMVNALMQGIAWNEVMKIGLGG